MFDVVVLGGTPDAGIELATKSGRHIPNSQAVEPDPHALRTARRIEARHAWWVKRREPCGTYNCAGHVWAARRTAIYETADYLMILSEDGYRKVAVSSQCQVGDVVTYRLIAPPQTILHIGVVAELRPFAGSLIPWLLSKWNDSSGEYFHHFEDVSLKDQFQRNEYEIEFWTDT